MSSKQEGTEAAEVMQSYTKGLKVPTLIGAFTDGTRIPGGPYTAAQGVCGATTLVLGYMLHGIWGGWLQSAWPHFEFLDWPLLLLVAAAVLKVTGYVPETTRNPVVIATDGGRASLAPRFGTRRGKPVKAATGPVRVTGRILVATSDSAGQPSLPPIDSAPPAAPETPQIPVSSPSDPFPSTGAASVSNVAQLLASAPKELQR